MIRADISPDTLLYPANIHRILLFFCLFTCFSGIVFGQDLNSKPITGTVLNERMEPVTAATVILFDAEAQLLSKTTTDSLGVFKIQHHNTPGNYLIEIQHLAYAVYRSSVLTSTNINLGTIYLLGMENTLKEVEVRGKRSIIEVSGGIITYHVENSIGGQDVSALEALKRAPGVHVENERNITLNGKGGVQVLLDGRNTYLSGDELTDLLKSLSSNDIKSIEIINSPTAKFDASGSAGIINIKTKKNQMKGLNGNVTTTVAYGVSPKQLQNISVNYRVNKINVYGHYNHTLGNFNYTYGTHRFQHGKSYDSHTDDVDKRQKMSGGIGIDYFMNAKSTFGFLANSNFILGGGITDTKTDISFIPSTAIVETLEAINDYYGQGTARYNFNLNYRFEDTLGHILNIDADYGLFDKWNKNLQSNIYRDHKGRITDEYLYRTLNGIDIDLKGIKVDYAVKRWNGTIESGIKYAHVGSVNDSRFYHVKQHQDSLDNRRTNDFHFQEGIVSAHLDYKRTLKKWSFQGGVRLEHTNSEGLLLHRGDDVASDDRIRRNFTHLFPFFSVAAQPAENQHLSLSYAKRIERPAYQDLNPFIYMLDELSFWQGNPFLNPELTHRLTLLYSHRNATILTLNAAYSDQFNARITDTLDTEKIVMIRRNVGTQKNWSLALTQNISPNPWWDLTFNGLIYYIQNQVSFDEYRNLNLQQLAGRISLQQSFRLPFRMRAEVLALYQSNRLSGANTFSKAMSQVDIGVQKSLLQDRGTLRLAINDVYKGNQTNNTQTFPGFHSTNYGYYESRQVRVSFSYRFSRGESRAQRTRKSSLESESGRIN